MVAAKSMKLFRLFAWRKKDIGLFTLLLEKGCEIGARWLLAFYELWIEAVFGCIRGLCES